MTSLTNLTRVLLQNASGTGSLVTILTPGIYAWVTEGTFGGSIVYFEVLGADGVTWQTVVFSSVTSRVPILIEQGKCVRARVLGGTSPSITSRLEFIT
jgi:hypothetical protein